MLKPGKKVRNSGQSPSEAGKDDLIGKNLTEIEKYMDEIFSEQLTKRIQKMIKEKDSLTEIKEEKRKSDVVKRHVRKHSSVKVGWAQGRMGVINGDFL